MDRLGHEQKMIYAEGLGVTYPVSAARWGPSRGQPVEMGGGDRRRSRERGSLCVLPCAGRATIAYVVGHLGRIHPPDGLGDAVVANVLDICWRGVVVVVAALAVGAEAVRVLDTQIEALRPKAGTHVNTGRCRGGKREGWEWVAKRTGSALTRTLRHVRGAWQS